jgi:hypothetical protein
VELLLRISLYNPFSIGGFVGIHDYSMKKALLVRVTASGNG